MALSAGDRLGPYQVLERIGAGGMGEVYKARDTRLDRLVAVKVSTEEFSERFQREARAIAALNHPHICTLHDAGPNYLIMEYIDGSPPRGPLPVGEVLRIGIQVAEALSHAHRHGVVHRDLKPGNILVTKAGAKVLDFGLAKVRRADSGVRAAETAGPDSLTLAITEHGTVVGTPEYMAPEQIAGQEADARTDIFAFGLVLYELLTGRRAFSGNTRASLMASILSSEPPPVTLLQPLTPPALEHLVRTCLAKDPDARRQSMHDVALELRWIAEGGSQAGLPRPVVAQRKRREYASWAVAAAACLALLVLAVIHFRETPPAPRTMRFEQPMPAGLIPRAYERPVISPDGRRLVFGSAPPGGVPGLFLRPMDALQPSPLPAGPDPFEPFWSPDGRSIGYFSRGQLRRYDIAGGSDQAICAVPANYGGAWNREGVILIGGEGPLYRASASGGEARLLLGLDSARKESAQRWPHFLPDGRHFLYTSLAGDAGNAAIYLGSLDSKESRLLVRADSNAAFAHPGFLVFARGATLFAQRFDPRKLQIFGEPVALAERVGSFRLYALSHFSASLDGMLAYWPAVTTTLQLTWYDRNGRRLGPVGEPRHYRQVTLAPDERQVGTQIRDPQTGTDDLWLTDLKTGVMSRFTSDPRGEDSVIWSADGRQIAFASNRSGRMAAYRKEVGGRGEDLVFGSDEPIYPAQWLADGSLLLLNYGGRSFLRLAPGSSKPEVLLKTEYFKDGVRVSPDGRWIAYNSNESGRWEVYIASFPGFTQRRQVSPSGGVQAYWRKDQTELYYLSLDGNLMAVPVGLGTAPETGAPRVLFQTRVTVSPTADQYVVSKDGRFLLADPVDSGQPSFQFIVDWPAAVAK